MKRAGLLAAFAVLAGCGTRVTPLPVYGQVPRFALTAQMGQQFESRALEGNIWVADFMFTSCLGPCPRMASQMRWVGRQVADLPQVRLVSFTVDPKRDTPEVLAAYARKFPVEPGRWFFLTGAQSTLQQLDRNAFKLGDVDGSLMHSTRFVLVDQRGRVRGYYRTDEENGLKPLIGDIRRLAKEQS